MRLGQGLQQMSRDQQQQEAAREARAAAEARAQAKVIDAKANLENSKLVAESEEYRIRRLASADAERRRDERTRQLGDVLVAGQRADGVAHPGEPPRARARLSGP